MDELVKEHFPVGALISGTSYRVRSLIGAGGMGAVYEVEHVELRKLFVLKALRVELMGRRDLAARMENEWRALGRLQHPNIVLVTDAGRTASGVPFFVMERLEGEPLSSRLGREGKLGLGDALRLCEGILHGLAASHALGIVHRDIKPQNVFLPRGGGVKLLDYGVAKLRDGATSVVTRWGMAIGTPKYMSPEQAAGKAVDGRADIYAVGLVLFELLAGDGPFAHCRDASELLLAHMGELPVRLDALNPQVPPELADLVLRWLSKAPGDRPADAETAAREIGCLLRRFGKERGPLDMAPTLRAEDEGLAHRLPWLESSAPRVGQRDSEIETAGNSARRSAELLPGDQVAARRCTSRDYRSRSRPPCRGHVWRRTGGLLRAPREGAGSLWLLGDACRPQRPRAEGACPSTGDLPWSSWVAVALLACCLTLVALQLGTRAGASGQPVAWIRAAGPSSPPVAALAVLQERALSERGTANGDGKETQGVPAPESIAQQPLARVERDRSGRGLAAERGATPAGLGRSGKALAEVNQPSGRAPSLGAPRASFSEACCLEACCLEACCLEACCLEERGPGTCSPGAQRGKTESAGPSEAIPDSAHGGQPTETASP
jgi:eukaryotic-like serine/threonine-protein kinase